MVISMLRILHETMEIQLKQWWTYMNRAEDRIVNERLLLINIQVEYYHRLNIYK